MTFRIGAWIGIAVALVASAGGALAQSPRVCPDPAFFLQPDSLVLALHDGFNSPSARRIFTEVHYFEGDPHLTVGMGHFTYGNIAELFKRLKQDQKTWALVTEDWKSAMDKTPGAWSALEKEASAWSKKEEQARFAGRDARAVSAALDELLCTSGDKNCVDTRLRPWSHRVGTGFNVKDKNKDKLKDKDKDKEHWFTAGWQAVATLKPVAEHQIRHWLDRVVIPAQETANAAGVDTLGGIASFASAKSTGIELLNVKGLRAPAQARPTGQNFDEGLLNADWKSLKVWQDYVRKKPRDGKIRDRMQRIWQKFFEASWGPLPKSRLVADLQEIPRHTGCYMARGTIDKAPALVPEPLSVCPDKPPSATAGRCSVSARRQK